MRPIDRQEPKLRRIQRRGDHIENEVVRIESPIEQDMPTLGRMQQRREDAPNIEMLGEIKPENFDRVFGQQTDTAPKSDPAPSRAKYKMQRLWLTPMFRAMVRTGLPVITLMGVGLYLLSDEEVRLKFSTSLADAREQFQARPEFKIEYLKVAGGSDETAELIRNKLGLKLPITSFDLDLESMKERIEDLDAVKTASIFVQSDNLLKVEVTERLPVLIWRKGDELELLDRTGTRAGVLKTRQDRADLPLIAGEAAEEALGEAIALYDRAEPIWERIRGLNRLGLRRWDVILDRGQIIQLPEDDALAALDRILALNSTQKILERDLRVIDMRDAQRTIIRLSQGGTAIIRASGKVDQ